MVFDGYEELRKAVSSRNLEERKQFKTAHKDRKCWKAICLHSKIEQPCFWSLSASLRRGTSGEWIIKKHNPTHTCRVDYTSVRDDRNCTSAFIADLLTEKLVADPGYKVRNIVVDVKDKFGINVEYKKAWYARQIGLKNIYGDWDKSYDDLPKYLRSLVSRNPGSVMDFHTIGSEKGPNYCEFKYAFWALKAAIDGFRYCLPVITIDGTHLYGKYKGHLLLAVCMNGNKEIFPLAYSIVDSENGNSWTWFLRLLASHVFPNHDSICIISDRHPGIDVAFDVLPQLHPARVHRRYCLRHLRSNVMTKIPRNKGGLKSLIWEAGVAVTRSDFHKAMSIIEKKWPEAYNYLSDIPEQSWALSYDGGYRFGIMTTNSSESFNSTLKGCRMLPVTAIARLTFNKLVAMFLDRRAAGDLMLQEGLRWPKNICKELSVREQFKYAATIKPYNHQIGLYEVAIDKPSIYRPNVQFHELNLDQETCTCGEWAVDGLPCAHVLAACHFRRSAPDSFVPPVFTLNYYRMCYAADLYPVPTEDHRNSRAIILPPSTARRKSHRGQQQRSRYQNEMDYGGRRRRRRRRCGNCRENHTTQQCPNFNNDN